MGTETLNAPPAGPQGLPEQVAESSPLCSLALGTQSLRWPSPDLGGRPREMGACGHQWWGDICIEWHAARSLTEVTSDCSPRVPGWWSGICPPGSCAGSFPVPQAQPVSESSLLAWAESAAVGAAVFSRRPRSQPPTLPLPVLSWMPREDSDLQVT